ncbi:hypothetical protein BDN67DRAFT_750212 [Paxillus ammoniavirescens]|nr:hypothetical protein BDN67DRAFT_750212 [Paxillus ammoniavirescens]
MLQCWSLDTCYLGVEGRWTTRSVLVRGGEGGSPVAIATIPCALVATGTSTPALECDLDGRGFPIAIIMLQDLNQSYGTSRRRIHPPDKSEFVRGVHTKVSEQLAKYTDRMHQWRSRLLARTSEMVFNRSSFPRPPSPPLPLVLFFSCRFLTLEFPTRTY